MAAGRPGSQQKALMQEKRELARRLLGQGLTVAQIATQLRCSQVFVRRERAALLLEGAEGQAAGE